MIDSQNLGLCEEIAEELYTKYNEMTNSGEQSVLAAATDLYRLPADIKILNTTFLDGVQLGLVLSATQPATAGQLLEFISIIKPNNLKIQAYAKILALLLEKFNNKVLA